MYCFNLEFSVPCKNWQATRDKILSINFKTEEPSLTRYKLMSGKDDSEHFRFSADYMEDIRIVMNLLKGGN